MPDPFAFFADPSQLALGVAPPAPTPQPKPAAPAASAAAPLRTAASTMIAPPTPAPAPVAAPAAPERAGERPSPPSSVDQFMHLVRAHESGGNDKASSGVANGRYQFTPSTWAGVARNHPELGLHPNDIWDGAKQDLAMRAITRDYQSVLSAQGIPATMPNMFMLHFLGTGGGPKFLHQMAANPNANAAAAFPLEAQYNPTIFHDKAGQPRTLSQVYSLMTKTFGGPGAPPIDTHTASAPAGETAAIASFDKAAGVPTTPQGFVEGRASAENLSNALPPPLPGMKLDPPKHEGLKLPPPLPGMKLDLKSDTPLTKTNPYGGEAPKPVAPADPKKSLAEVEGYDPAPPGAMGAVGEPRFADPKGQQEYDKRSQEIDKGVLAGMAQDVTGPASLLPNWLGGGAAERANTALDKAGDPTARKIGSALPMLAPMGGVGAAAKAGGKALEAGESLIPSMLKGAGWSAGAGAANASSHPTGSDTMGGRWAGKAPGMAEEGLISGLIGGALPGAATGLKWLYSEAGSLKKFISDAFGKEAKAAAEELRAGISAKTGEAMTAEERKIAEAKVEEGAARAKQAAADAQIKHLDEQQEKLRNRMQDRVKSAEAVAERAGQNAEQARAFAAHQEAAVAKAEESADKLAKDFAARPTMTQEDFGRQLQETAAKDAKELADKRRAESGFDAAVKSDGGKPSIPTKQFIAAVDEAEKRAVSDGAKATLGKLKQDLKSPVEGGSVSAVSIERARRIVEDLDSKIDGLPTSEAHEITALKDKFVAHMEDKASALKAARQKYAELSRPLDVYRDTGALAKSILEDPYSRRPIVDSTKIVGALLNKTEAGADALGHVLQKGELQDSARKFFNQKLVDVAGKNPTPSEAQFANFLRDNRLALDRAGLTNEFKDLAAAKATQERIAAEAKSGADTAKRAAGDAEKAATRAERDVSAAKALKDRAASPSTLKAQREAPETARKQAVSELADAASKQKAARDIQEHLAKFGNKLDPKVARTGPEVTKEAEKTADWLKDKGYLDAAAHKDLLTKIREVEQMNVDSASAAKRVKQILIAAAVLGLGATGAEIGRVVSHRVTP